MSAIRHIVPVNLKYEEGDPRIDEFFEAAKRLLGSIPTVTEYHHYKQIHTETPFKYGFVLEFKNEKDMQDYFVHPNSIEFTEKYWDPGIKDFLDCNFVLFPN